MSGVRVYCLLRARRRSDARVPAPCIDDLCHSGGQTVCGLYWGEDFCEHGYDPESCDECNADRDDWDRDQFNDDFEPQEQRR